MAKKIRLDQLLVDRGVFETAADVLPYVLAHEVKVDDTYATSAAQLVARDADVQVKDRTRYVSRGGVKLAGALEAFELDVTGLNCIDIGCSTGGFTDCLLQAGAATVAAVDVGYGDLAWKLRKDPRVKVFERTNIRTADLATLGGPFDMAVADLSFIGLASLAPVFASLVKRDGLFVGLVKPQFESQHDETDDRGVVNDPAVRQRVVDEVRQALSSAGFSCEGLIESPIKGKRSGNVEYLLMAKRL